MVAGTRSKPAKGLRAMARVYAGWGFSQAFYRERLDIERLGYSSLEDFLVGFWEGFFLPKDANNLLAMLWTWQNGDISDNELYNGDFKRGIGRDQGKGLCHAGPDRSLLSAGGQPIRGRQHAEREIAARPLDLGPFRRRARYQSGRWQVH